MISCEQEQYREWQTRLNDIQAALELLESETDQQLEQELLANFYFLTNELKHVEIINLLNYPFDGKGAFITITASEPNLDSHDWVQMLLRMYSYWCESHDYKIQLVDESCREWGGFEYVILEISSKYAYGYLKSEQGIHQLKKISPLPEPSTIQTSSAKVEVIPMVDESIDFEIPEQDLKIYLEPTYSTTNRISVLAKVNHIPTGISITCINERNQLANSEKALAVVKSKLFALVEAQGVPLSNIKKPSPKNLANDPIREYIFHPYPKVRDLRTNQETADIEEVMKGNLDIFTKAYLKQGIT